MPIGRNHLKKLRDKCDSWIRSFNASKADRSITAGNTSTSEFERKCRENDGKPFAFDDGNMRSLHFDERCMQSAMWLDAPNELVFSYTRCMMGFMLMNPAPKHILMIGLGGGSLAKFCYEYLPDAQITVLEIDADVIALRDMFMIPADDERLKIVHADAIDYVKHCEAQFDVILLDGFDAAGPVANLNEQHFYSACHKALNPEGILVANMFGKAVELAALLGRLHTEFESPAWWGKSLDSHNLIAIAHKSSARLSRRALMDKAARLDHDYKLELEQFVDRLQTTSLNNPMFERERLASDSGFFSQRYTAEMTYAIKEAMRLDKAIARTRLEWIQAHQYSYE